MAGSRRVTTTARSGNAEVAAIGGNVDLSTGAEGSGLILGRKVATLEDNHPSPIRMATASR